MTDNRTPDASTRPALHQVVERIGKLEQLDAPAETIAKKIRDLVGPGPLKDALSGTFLGHALHPLLTDVPIGTWTSAGLLDAFGGRDSEKAAERLIGIGLLAVLPTAAAGYTDWADTEPSSAHVRRIGIVHAAANVTAATLYGASWLARRRGRRERGIAYALAGAGVLAVGGHLGGHLSYSEGVGVDQTTFEDAPTDWTSTGVREAELGEGESRRAEVGPVAVLLVRHGGRVHALSNRCNHRGGQLSDGELVDGCVECPLHGSRFRLADGSVERGPASAPQPTYAVRTQEGVLEVRIADDPTG